MSQASEDLSERLVVYGAYGHTARFIAAELNEKRLGHRWTVPDSQGQTRTAPARGHGIGALLIETLRDIASQQRWARLYWLTHTDDTRARGLYDRFAPADGFVRYTLPVDLTAIAEPTS